MERITAWWNSLSRREQYMMAVMLALLGAVALWLAVYRPLQGALERARIVHEIAVARHASVESKIAQLKRTRQSLRVSTRPVEQIVGGSALDSGFTLGQVQRRPDARLAFTIPSAKSSALLAWMTALEQHGVAIISFTISPSGAVGTVKSQMVVQKARP